MQLHLELFHVHTLIKEISDTVKPLMDSNNNRFLVDEQGELGSMYADLTKVRQTIFNLLSNAAKFSPPGCLVTVRCCEEEERVTIQVIDQGEGIPEAFRPRIFGRFAQADSSHSRRFEGAGLGLSIARNLVQAMGGRLGFVSESGRGSTFYFDLPRRAERSGTSAASAA